MMKAFVRSTLLHLLDGERKNLLYSDFVIMTLTRRRRAYISQDAIGGQNLEGLEQVFFQQSRRGKSYTFHHCPLSALLV